MTPARTPFADLPPAQQAGILCNDPEFQRFAAQRCALPVDATNAKAAAEFLRNVCQIESRSELNTDPDKNHRFQALRTTFDAWAGRIASPNQ